jgi:hypothetical protein
MQTATRLASAIMMAAMFTLVGLAGTALADKEDGKEHKEDTKHQYVNLGVIGDVGIFCGILPTSTGDIVVPDGSRDGTITLVPDTPINIPGVDNENLCLGGAIGDYNSADGVDAWDVWIHDYVWNGLCDSYTIPGQSALCAFPNPEGGLGVEGAAELALETATGQGWTVDLKSAGLARTETTYDRPTLEKAPGADELECVPITGDDPTTGPRVCLQENIGAQGATRVANQFGFCGQGSIDAASGMIDPFDVSDGPDSASATNVEVTKVVFTDSVLFYLLDCPLVEAVSGQIKPFYDIVADIVNSVLCPVPIVNIEVICILDFPIVSSNCYTDKVINGPNALQNTINIGVVALVGEIGWTHEETETCKDEPTHGDWIASDAGLVLALKGIPAGECVSAVYVASGVALSTVDCEPSADCAFTGAGFDSAGYAFEQSVECDAESGPTCDGTYAALLVSVAGDEADATLSCGARGATSLATNGSPVDQDASTGVLGTPYSCDMTYRAVAAQVPYLAVAGCR